MDQRVVVVTGASRGIGAAIAAGLAEAGYIVGCLSRSGAQPEGPSLGDEAARRLIPIIADVTDPAAMTRAFDALAERGTIAGLVNNAGTHTEGRSADLPLDSWNAQIEANATSVLIGCQAAFPFLKRAGGGLIVNIGSFFDKIGVKRNVAYCASKAAVGAITRVLAVEWAGQSIAVVNVAPGYILTNLNRDALSAGPLSEYLEKRIPTGGPGAAADIARLIVSLFKLDGRFLTGETIYVDGAQSVAH